MKFIDMGIKVVEMTGRQKEARAFETDFRCARGWKLDCSRQLSTDQSLPANIGGSLDCRLNLSLYLGRVAKAMKEN